MNQENGYDSEEENVHENRYVTENKVGDNFGGSK